MRRLTEPSSQQQLLQQQGVGHPSQPPLVWGGGSGDILGAAGLHMHKGGASSAGAAAWGPGSSKPGAPHISIPVTLEAVVAHASMAGSLTGAPPPAPHVPPANLARALTGPTPPWAHQLPPPEPLPSAHAMVFKMKGLSPSTSSKPKGGRSAEPSAGGGVTRRYSLQHPDAAAGDQPVGARGSGMGGAFLPTSERRAASAAGVTRVGSINGRGGGSTPGSGSGPHLMSSPGAGPQARFSLQRSSSGHGSAGAGTARGSSAGPMLMSTPTTPAQVQAAAASAQRWGRPVTAPPPLSPAVTAVTAQATSQPGRPRMPAMPPAPILLTSTQGVHPVLPAGLPGDGNSATGGMPSLPSNQGQQHQLYQVTAASAAGAHEAAGGGAAPVPHFMLPLDVQRQHGEGPTEGGPEGGSAPSSPVMLSPHHQKPVRSQRLSSNRKPAPQQHVPPAQPAVSTLHGLAILVANTVPGARLGPLPKQEGPVGAQSGQSDGEDSSRATSPTSASSPKSPTRRRRSAFCVTSVTEQGPPVPVSDLQGTRAL